MLEYPQIPPKEENCRQIDVLDKGFIRLVDYMGDDRAIVQAARVSTGTGLKSAKEDKQLIFYLMEHAHTSPYEMVELKFHVKMPIFVARQWVRHRTANINEISGRYSVLKDEFFVPNVHRTQDIVNKQGSENPLPISPEIRQLFVEEQHEAYDHYLDYVDNHGLARELARTNLPISIYTEMYWKIDLHNLFHFLKLRLDSHAQYEIRVYAQAILELLRPIVPWSVEAWEEFVLNAKTFSATEMSVIKDLVSTEYMKEILEGKLNKRQIKEFLDKLDLSL